MQIFKKILNLFINVILFISLFMVIYYVYPYITTLKTYPKDKINMDYFSIAVINKDTKEKEVITLKKYRNNFNYYKLLKKDSVIKPYKNENKDYEFILRKDKDTYFLIHNSEDFNIWRSYTIIGDIVKPISSHSLHAMMSIPIFFITLILFCIIIVLKRKFILKKYKII